MKNEPAFPVSRAADHMYCGLTIRDYFAAKAIQGLLANEKQMLRYGDYGLNLGRPSSQVAAEAAYVQADAMLAAREAE